MKKLGLFDNYFLHIKKLDWIEFRKKIRRNNVERVYILSCVSLLFFILLLLLDYIRYTDGLLHNNIIYELLLYTHLALGALIIPIIIISKNRKRIQSGQYKYSLALIYSSMIFIAFLLLTMAILSIIDRNAVIVYVIFVLLINFVVIFPHVERIIFNLISLIIIICAICFIDAALERGITPMYTNFLECISVAILAFSLSTYLYNNEVKRFTYERVLQEKNLLMEEEKKISNALSQKLKELNTQKNKLYENITHEFRTPLTVILGMTDLLRSFIKNKDLSQQDEAIDMIEANGKNLLNLINELLDLSKLESGVMKLHLTQRDIISFLRYVSESFQSYALSKDIHLSFITDLESFTIDFDIEKMQQVHSNLLSNAIKFTPEAGRINVLVKMTKNNGSETLIINVKDSGIGIATEKIPYIFDRFYQVDDPAIRQQNGSGIGLALTKELVKLMNGDICVSSEPGRGTEFSISLPVSRLSEKISKEQAVESIRPTHIPSFLKAPVSKRSVSFASQIKRSRVLIIEDNPDVMHYLKLCLENNYSLESSYDGQKGIDKAIEIVPDIIICDVMMPEKNGYEVCEILKKDERTNHIPIILLTAKVNTTDKLTGLASGADVYLTKPFQREELLVHLKNLVAVRKQLQQKYSKGTEFWEGAILNNDKQSNQDDAFLHKINKLIEDNISDENFGNIQLCIAMTMSRSQIHRKIKALTNLSTSIYIRTIRLYKAKELLQSTDLNISEIGYEVGFKDPNYFTRAFVEEFGIPPSATRN
ncbi:MAG: signal transduction histidine kinase/DNA-binding response OmpR family regulator [Saprospiraceae bacterium]|jgi:signal transduction histidine kinase/DNA-binding response OmpR family regulator